MMSFRGHQLNDLSVPASTAWLLTEIAEAKGRQDLYAWQSPQVLKALRDMARRDMAREGRVRCLGRGPGAEWERG